MPPTITDLDELVAGLAPKDRARFDRLYAFNRSTARVLPPKTMEDWIVKQFKYLSAEPEGSPAWRGEVLEKVRHQRIVHVLNRVTCQATLFNAVRALKPVEAKDSAEIEQEIAKTRGGPFCRPLELTPENTFGRIGRTKTCANVAAYDGWHGLVIFEEHSPLAFREDAYRPEQVADMLATAREWAAKVHAEDAEARFFFLMWNCLWKAAASITHGHAQMVVGRKFHYGKVERLRRDAAAYAAEHGADYFEDFVAAHASLGLTDRRRGETVTTMAHLTPIKERELVIVADDGLDSAGLPKAVWRALKVYTRLGVESFNLAVYAPPLGGADPAWAEFPVQVFLVDRGDLKTKTADIGGMELYTSSVVSSDPFRLVEAVRNL